LGYRTVKKLWRYVKPFSSDTGTSRTDGQTDKQTNWTAISISRVSVLMRDNKIVCYLQRTFNSNRKLKQQVRK